MLCLSHLLILYNYTAHIVRNKTATSTAVASLKAVSRWAVTGTPIQNSLSDIAGLLRFMHFRPYDNAKTFDEDVVEFFRQNDISEGTRRLKALCQPIMLRRSKDIVVLPPAQDFVRTVSFSQDEKREYRRIEMEAQSSLDDYSYQNSGRIPTQLSKIQLINKLRVFCNLGLGLKSSTLANNQIRTAMNLETDSAATIAASDIVLGGAICAGCQRITGTPDMQSPSDNGVQAYYSQCCQVYCNSCAALHNYEAATGCSCIGKPPCLLQAVSSDLVQKAMEGPCTSNQVGHGIVSSKVHALVKEILACLPEKRYVLE